MEQRNSINSERLAKVIFKQLSHNSETWQNNVPREYILLLPIAYIFTGGKAFCL